MVQIRYTEFKALDQVLKQMYKNIKFPGLPKKGLILTTKRKDQRREYLEKILNNIVLEAKREPGLKVSLLGTLYNFVFKADHKEVKDF